MSEKFARTFSKPTGALVLEDGTVLEGRGIGKLGEAVGEVCFNTSMTGYQEIITDPSYAGQIITFTFPHIGNVGANDEDDESDRPLACGVLFRTDITSPSNFRARLHLDEWLCANGVIGVSGIDTRALTLHIRDGGAPKGVITNYGDLEFEARRCQQMALEWSGLEGMDLATDAGTGSIVKWS